MFQVFHSIASAIRELNTTAARWLAEERVNWKNLNTISRQNADGLDTLTTESLRQDDIVIELRLYYEQLEKTVLRLGNRLSIAECNIEQHTDQQRHTRKRRDVSEDAPAIPDYATAIIEGGDGPPVMGIPTSCQSFNELHGIEGEN